MKTKQCRGSSSLAQQEDRDVCFRKRVTESGKTRDDAKQFGAGDVASELSE